MPFRSATYPQCPRCRIGLALNTRGAACGRCGGIWLEASTLTLLWRDRPLGEAAASRLVCWHCRQPMRGVSDGMVTRDECDAHGMWFDRGELSALFGRSDDHVVLARLGELGPPPPLCPRCRVPLATATAPARCGRCQGLWFPVEALGDEHAAAGRSSSLWWKQAGSCPYCKMPMAVHAMTSTEPVVIDRCDRHGLWFDRGELAVLVGASGDDEALQRVGYPISPPGRAPRR